ncbi:MAG: hypothetical protein JSS22_03650 [Proteobacteria bacterium]|nr:hypothetical protein [Pseudomonadota bacterium]
MAAIAKVLSRAFSTSEKPETFQLLTIFCLTGLLVSVLLANYAAGLNLEWPTDLF